VVRLRQATDAEGNDTPRVLELAFLNASFETGFANPIDKAIREHHGEVLLITKGAATNVLQGCSQVERSDGSLVPMATASSRIDQLYREFSGQGYRTLGVAYRRLDASQAIMRDDERDMIFVGFLILADPSPKAGIDRTIRDLAGLSVRLKLITGDNVLVAAHVSQQIELTNTPPLTGSQMRRSRTKRCARRSGRADRCLCRDRTQSEGAVDPCIETRRPRRRLHRRRHQRRFSPACGRRGDQRRFRRRCRA
jgi:Mg2+-importing ATPase